MDETSYHSLFLETMSVKFQVVYVFKNQKFVFNLFGLILFTEEIGERICLILLVEED